MQRLPNQAEKSEYYNAHTSPDHNESTARPNALSSKPDKPLPIGALIVVVGLLLVGSLVPVVFLAIAPSLAPNNSEITSTFENFLILSKEGRSAEAFAMLTPELQAKSSLAKFEQKFRSRMATDLREYQGIIWQHVTKASTKSGANFADVKGVLRGINDEVVARLYETNGKWRVELFYVGRISTSSIT